MDDEVLASRARVSRRRLLAVGGSIGIGTLLAACGGEGGSPSGSAPAETTVTTPEGTTATIQPTTSADSDVVALLNKAPTCSLSKEQTQGPYWFDVDSIRSDVTEDRPGTELALSLRVQDLAQCDADGTPGAISNAVVEIWHCDAGGSYSGFESGSTGPPGQGGGEVSDGSYSEGDQEASPTDEETYLRGAQVSGKDGVVQFTTIYPGWYQGRTVHIHVKVHINKKTVLTSQLFFDESVNTEVFKATPYSARTGRDTFNDGDSIYDASGLVAISKQDDRYLGAINLGVNA